MGETINFPNELEEKISPEQVKQLGETMKTLLGEEDGVFSFLNSVSTLLEMEDREFCLLAPGILDSFQRTINNPNDKLALAQSFNAAGARAEDITASFVTLTESLETLDSVSKQKKDFLKEILATMCNAINDTEGISKRFIQIPIEFCHTDAKMPTYANVGDSGMDVYATEDVIINPGETKLVSTGIKFALPPGFEVQVRPKSGRALKTKLRIPNSPGTIDAGYRDEIKVIIENIEPAIKDIGYEFDEETHLPIITSIIHGSPYTINKGDKFAQLVLMEVPKAVFFNVEKVNEIGENRNGGFGSTGVK